MNREQVTRRDFPQAGGGYDRASVDAHLLAVDALIAAAEAEVAALKVERDTLRRATATGAPDETADAPSVSSAPDRTGAVLPTTPEVDSADPAGSVSGEGGGSDDEVSARLVATKMVMDGADREAIRSRLEADYDLEDSGGLIEDLFERLG